MVELIKLSIISTIGIVGSFIIFGFILGFIERQTEINFYRKFGEKSIVITGFIGTTVHEISHYIMCKIFLHRVTDVKLFSINMNDNELGHVSHSYNRRNLYQRVGNFFIGIAPMIFGTFIIIILFKFLLPNSFNNVVQGLDLTKYMELTNNFNIINFMGDLLNDSMIIIISIFALSNLLTFKFWIFLFLAVSISTHMSLSKADFKNSLDGIIFIFILSFIFNFVLLFMGIGVTRIFYFILSYNIMIIVFLFFSIIFSVISFIISKIFSLI